MLGLHDEVIEVNGQNLPVASIGNIDDSLVLRNIIDQLVIDGRLDIYRYVLSEVARNPFTDTDTLRLIADNDFADTDNILLNIAENNNTDSGTLLNIIGNTGCTSDVLASVAAHHAANEEIFEQIMEHEENNDVVMAAIAANTNASDDIIKKIIYSKDMTNMTLLIIKSRNNVNPEILTLLTEREKITNIINALKISVTPGMATRALKLCASSPAHNIIMDDIDPLQEIIKRTTIEELKALASDPTTDPKILKAIAISKKGYTVDILTAILKNPNIDRDIFDATLDITAMKRGPVWVVEHAREQIPGAHAAQNSNNKLFILLKQHHALDTLNMNRANMFNMLMKNKQMEEKNKAKEEKNIGNNEKIHQFKHEYNDGKKMDQ